MADDRLSSARADRGLPPAGSSASIPSSTPSSRPTPTPSAIAARRDAERRAGPRPRAAPRDPRPGQGQHRDPRRAWRRPPARSRWSAAGSRATRRLVAGCATPGPIILGKANLSEWANFRGLVPQAVKEAGAPPQRLERSGRCHAQPVRPRLGPVRLELRLGGRAGGEPVCGRHRHRDGRLDRLSVGQQRRSSASSRRSASCRPGRDHPDLAQPGHGRSDERGPSPTRRSS